MKTHLYLWITIIGWMTGIIFPGLCFSQKVDFSSYELDEKGYDNSRVMGSAETGFYVLQSNLPLEYSGDKIGFKTRKYRLVFFDFDLRPLWKQEIVANQKDQIIERIVYSNEKILMIMSKGTENNKREYFLQWINQKGIAAHGNDKAFEIQYKKGSDVLPVNATASENESQTLLMLSEITNDHHQVFNCILVDTLSKVKDSRLLDIPYGSEEFIADEFDVSDSGDIAISGVHFLDSKAARSKKNFGTTQIFMFRRNEPKPVYYDFIIPDKKIINSSFSFDNANSKLVMIGFYYEKESNTSGGVALARYDLRIPETTDIYFYPLVSKNVNPKGDRTADFGSGLSNYNISKMIMRSDGGVILISEAILITESSYYDYFTQTFNRRIQYDYNNIMTLSINTDATIDWSNIVRKEQESVDDGGIYSSFATLTLSDKIYFFFNRNIYQNSEVINANISFDGKSEEKDLMRNYDRLTLLPRFGKQISAEEFVMPAYQKKRLLLARISFL